IRESGEKSWTNHLFYVEPRAYKESSWWSRSTPTQRPGTHATPAEKGRCRSSVTKKHPVMAQNRTHDNPETTRRRKRFARNREALPDVHVQLLGTHTSHS